MRYNLITTAKYFYRRKQMITNKHTQEKHHEDIMPEYRCKSCGTIISKKAVICPKCGASQYSQPVSVLIFKVLSFLIPPAGFIMYIISHKKSSDRAKEYVLCAFAGICIMLIFFTVWNTFLII